VWLGSGPRSALLQQGGFSRCCCQTGRTKARSHVEARRQPRQRLSLAGRAGTLSNFAWKSGFLDQALTRTTTRPRGNLRWQALTRLARPGLILAGLLATAATAWPPAAAAASSSEWVAASRELAAPWPRLQARSGHFRDALQADGSSRYGDAVLGYGLLLTGVRDRDRRLARAGIRGVSAATRRLKRWFPERSFETWGVAAAYNVARARLRHWVSARRALRRWAPWLRRQQPTWIHARRYENKQLLDAVAILELQRTGLRSRTSAALLGGGRRAANARAAWLINRAIPAMVSASVRGDPSSNPLLSDPPSNPVAYHGLSYAMYARAVRLLGRRASWRARAVLRELGGTSWRLAAPDGDVAYWGRSLAQIWSLPATAYGLAVTARERGSRPAFDQRYFALAHRVLLRLRDYGVGPRGEWITPSLRESFSPALASLDWYARATEYGGLALVYLDWAIPFLPASHGPGEIAADRPGTALFGSGTARFANVRFGDIWYAARQNGEGSFRYDFGPIAVKRLSGGNWRNVIPLRPMGGGSAGPVLVTSSGQRALATGTSMGFGPNGSLLVSADFHSEGRVLRRGVPLEVQPTSCGVALTVSGQAGDRYEFSAFFRRGPLAVGQDRVTGAGQVAATNRPARISLAEGYASASDAPLTRAQFVVGPLPRAQSTTFTVC